VRERVAHARTLGLIKVRIADEDIKLAFIPVAQEELPQRCERTDLPAGSTACREHACGRGRCEEFVNEPRLPLPRRPGDECEDGSSRRTTLGESQQLQLARAADERDARGDPAEPFQIEGAERSERRNVFGRRVRDRPDEHLTGLRLLAEPRSDIHDGADAHLLARALSRREIHDSFSGLEPDAYRERHVGFLKRARPGSRGVGRA
jgi:hypothetical protein